MKKLVEINFKKMLLFMATIAVVGGCSSDDNISGTGTGEPGGDNDVPVAVDDDVTTVENTSVTITDLLENDTVFGYARVSEFDSDSEEGGSIVDNRDGSFTYTPPQNYIGEDSFTYTICDNARTPNCSSATVNVTVTAASPTAEDDSYEVGEGRTLTISNYLNNDQLLDNATVASVDTEGTDATVVLEENGNISYTPAAGFSGEDSFTYTICDDDEVPSCSTATITVTVVDEGSPVANDDRIFLALGSTGLTISTLLNNDTVVDDAVITSVEAEGNGTVELNADGTVTYTPVAGFTGEDSFTYTLCDDDTPDPSCSEATVTISIVEAVSFDIPAHLQDYYSSFTFTTSTDANYSLLSDLTISEHTTILSYGQRHEYLYDADEDPENPDNVILMYTGESRYWREYQSGSNSYSPQTFNTEHIYPQSRLTSADAVTDLHHLRVSDAEVNSTRLNYPFTDASGEARLIGEDSWYPGDEWKGDVARMVMYLNIRYGETFPKVGNLDLFLKWNAEDPVSAFEVQRNNVIETAQGNRNPFIDNPYLATLIWGGPQAENLWD